MTDTSARYTIQTVCECQAILEAELDQEHQVLRGWAMRDGVMRDGERDTAPANTVSIPREIFDVVWQCPRCGRNTLRTFHVGAIRRAG